MKKPKLNLFLILQKIRLSLFWTKEMKRKKNNKLKNIIGSYILKLQNKI